MNIYELYGRMAEDLSRIHDNRDALMTLIKDIKMGVLPLDRLVVTDQLIEIIPEDIDEQTNGHKTEESVPFNPA